MAKSSTRCKVVHRDRFSELPRNLQETILDLLPLRDAVRSSILSKKWRYFWTIIPRLIFDHHFLMTITPKLDRFQDPKLKTRVFLCLIYKILRLHSGLLLKFSLRFLEHCDAQMISDQISRWIPLLSRKCVKQLTLQNFVSRGCHYYDFDPNSFSSLELSHLKLRCARLPEVGAFSNLTNLKLVSCCVPLHSIGECVFECPVLERLTLKGCSGLYQTDFHAPNLKCLYLEAFDIALKGLKTITDFVFCLLIDLGGLDARLGPSRTYNVATFLSCLHKVEKLIIGYYSLQHLAYAADIPKRDPEPLNYLKDLVIYYVDFANMLEVACIIYIIRSAPYLCNLEISGRSTNDADRESVKNLEVENSDNCNLDHLEYVRFNYFKAFATEVELIKFIVERSPLLKMMYIHCSVHMNTDEVAQQMEKFTFASPVAIICFVRDMNI